MSCLGALNLFLADLYSPICLFVRLHFYTFPFLFLLLLLYINVYVLVMYIPVRLPVS
jgi:hypothetical protein